MAHKPPFNPSDQVPLSSIPIVAIGAAAGGAEALSELLTNLSPTTGMAYIYIQHADMDDTMLADTDLIAVLSQTTTMPVVLATDQLPILPNHLYVIGPESARTNHDPEIIDDAITFIPRQQVSPPAANLPIDRFFLTLADRQRAGTVAILLSGSASDGTLGMRAIRATGGLTFAQNETALFQGMPRSAIAEGLIDRVLAPADMARELEQVSQQLTAFREAAGANAPEKTYIALDGNQTETDKAQIQPDHSTETGEELSETTQVSVAELSEVFADDTEADLWRIL